VFGCEATSESDLTLAWAPPNCWATPQVTEKAKHYGISKLLPEAVDPAKDLVLQYELKLTNGLGCGGAYIKFLTADGEFTPSGLKDDTPYTVMFGPDKCGATNKVGACDQDHRQRGCRRLGLSVASCHCCRRCRRQPGRYCLPP